MLGNNSPVHHGASIPGIYTPSSSTALPVHESNQSYSQQSLSMDSSVSVDDLAVVQQPQTPVNTLRPTPPEAVVALLHEEPMPEEHEEVERSSPLSVAQEVLLPEAQEKEAEDSNEDKKPEPNSNSMHVTVIEDKCRCDCDDQVVAEQDSGGCGQTVLAAPKDNSVNVNNYPSDSNVPHTAEAAENPDELLAGTSELVKNEDSRSSSVAKDSVLYDNRTVDIEQEETGEQVLAEDKEGSKNNIPKLSSDNNNQAEEMPVIQISNSGGGGGGGAHLTREPSIEGDEFMMHSRTASEDQKSDSPGIMQEDQATAAQPAAAATTGSSSEGCESEEAENGQRKQKQPINQRQSTDVQSSDMEFEDVPEDGRFLLRGCVAPAPTPAPMIAPLAEVEQDPQDEDFGMELGDDEVVEEENVGKKVKDRELEKQQSNESEFSAKTPPPGLLASLPEDHKKDLVEPIPLYACAKEPVEGEAQASNSTLALKKKRRKRKEGETVEGDAKDVAAVVEGEVSGAEAKGDPVCPWEDE